MRISPESSLNKRLDGCRRVAVLGVGSELRGDDAAGVLVVRALRHRVHEAPFRRLEFEGFEGANAPENLTGFISSFKPTHIVVVDAAEIGASAGEYREIAAGEIAETDFSTHTLPLQVIMDYLQQATGAVITLLGIQPASLRFGERPTPRMESGVRRLSRHLYEVMTECDGRLE